MTDEQLDYLRGQLTAALAEVERLREAAKSHRRAIDEYVDSHPEAPSYPWPAMDIALATTPEEPK